MGHGDMSLVADPNDQSLVLDGRARSAAVAAALRRAARQSRAPVSLISGGGGFRARKGDRLFWRGMVASFILMCVLPLIGASVYFGLVASDQYVTEIEFSLRNGEPSVLDSLSGMAGLASSQQNLDSQIIVNFIPSRGMLDKLSEDMDLRAMYSRPEVDWISRFNPKKPIEDFQKYWSNRVDAWIDPQSSIISVRVRAFTPEDSRKLAAKIVEHSESLVNEMTVRSRRDALRTAKAELDRSEATLVEATRVLRDKRNAVGVIDPTATAKALEKIIEPIQLQLARVRQEIAVASRSMSPDTAHMKILNAQADDLRTQIANLQAQIAGSRNDAGQSLADNLGSLGPLDLAVKTAQQQYANAAVQYEGARVDLDSQRAYLVNFIPPSTPEKALYPKRWWGWSLIVVPAALLWSILAGLAFLVRDNMAG